MREYKVEPIKVKSMGVVGLTGPYLEKLLNEKAAEGWIFDKVVQSISSIMNKEVALVVFYREKS